jgi:hypothetical protein
VQFQRYASARRLHQALPLTRAERVEVAPDGSDVVLDRVVCHSCIVIRQSAPGISLIRETVAVETPAMCASPGARTPPGSP